MAEGGEGLAEVGLVQTSVSASVEQVGSSAMADPVGFLAARGKKETTSDPIRPGEPGTSKYTPLIYGRDRGK